MKRERNRKQIFAAVGRVLIAALLVGLDQFTKYRISVRIPYGSSEPIIRDFFEISHVHNTGAAWGVMSGKTTALSVLTVLASLILLYLIAVSVHRMLSASLILIFSGAVGNLLDRIFRGYVIDFLRFLFGSYEFPNFNVADICITCGCILLALTILLVHKPMFREGSFAGKLARRLSDDTPKKQKEKAEEQHDDA